MTLPFIHRSPTEIEMEKFRLILSTYQDGSGMLIDNSQTLPGWRDFERAVAATFNGQTLENKSVYDIFLLDLSGKAYGISCKMREKLKHVESTGRVTIEISNASGEFWDAIKIKGLTEENYHRNSDLVGQIVIDVVHNWYTNVNHVDHRQSFHLCLQWDKRTGRYQLFQYPIYLPSAQNLDWEVTSRRLIGRNETGVVLEWYGFSGGQLKYYPPVTNAIWKSKIFQLEPLPTNLIHGLKQKAIAYFPDLWEALEKL